MRRAFVVGLGIGSILGMAWVFVSFTLLGKIFVFKHWIDRPVFAMFLLVLIMAGAAGAWFKMSD